MNVLNLHEIANEIDCSGKSLTQVFALSADLELQKKTKKKNNK